MRKIIILTLIMIALFLLVTNLVLMLVGFFTGVNLYKKYGNGIPEKSKFLSFKTSLMFIKVIYYITKKMSLISSYKTFSKI